MDKPVYVWVISKDGEHTILENGALPFVMSDYGANPVRFVPESLAKVAELSGSAASLYKISYAGVDYHGCIHMMASCIRQNKKHPESLTKLSNEPMYSTVTALLQ